MSDPTLREIFAMLGEHAELMDLHGVIVNDNFVGLLSRRLDAMEAPPVSPDQVQRAWHLGFFN